MLQRATMPIALAGVLALGPLYTYEVEDPVRRVTSLSAQKALDGIGVNCFTKGVDGFLACAPSETMFYLFYVALAGAGISAVLAILGIFPLLRKLAAVAGLITALIALAATALTGFKVLGGNGQLAWGAYATGGLALLMVLTSLFALRSDD